MPSLRTNDSSPSRTDIPRSRPPDDPSRLVLRNISPSAKRPSAWRYPAQHIPDGSPGIAANNADRPSPRLASLPAETSIYPDCTRCISAPSCGSPHAGIPPESIGSADGPPVDPAQTIARNICIPSCCFPWQEASPEPPTVPLKTEKREPCHKVNGRFGK